MKTLALLALAIVLGGCSTQPFDSSTLPGYLGESDMMSEGATYEYKPTIHVTVDEPEIDYERLYRKWKVRDMRYGRDPRKRGVHHVQW